MRHTPLRTDTSGNLIRLHSLWPAGLGLAAILFTAGSTQVYAQHSQQGLSSGSFQVAARNTKGQRRPSNRSRKSASKGVKPAWFSKGNANEPVQIIVSLPERKLTVYRGGEVVVSSRVSTGRKGFATPSGVFSILQKNRYHKSNIFSGVPMPYMQRLTWSGIALHGFTSVPRVPASAGCVRMPMAFASQLFKYTSKGAHVIVANEKAVPYDIENDNLIQPVPQSPLVMANAQQGEGAVRSDTDASVKARSTKPLRILITRRSIKGRTKEAQKLLNELSFEAGKVDGYLGPDTRKSIRRFQTTYGFKVNGRISDGLVEKMYEVAGKDMPTNGRMYVRQNFKPVFDAPVVIKNEEQTLGSHLFTAMYFKPDATKVRWSAVTLKKGSPPNRHALHGGLIKQPLKGVDQSKGAIEAATAADVLNRIVIPEESRMRLARILTPGSSIAISDDGISWETSPKSGSDFIVLMQ